MGLRLGSGLDWLVSPTFTRQREGAGRPSRHSDMGTSSEAQSSGYHMGMYSLAWPPGPSPAQSHQRRRTHGGLPVLVGIKAALFPYPSFAF